MGWPWERSGGDLQAKKAADAPAPNTGSQQQPDSLLGLLPKPMSTFEFGPPVTVGGTIMTGVCSGDNPNVIQACAWTLETLQGKPGDKKPAYRIEF